MTRTHHPPTAKTLRARASLKLRTPRFAADVWFVLALLTPVFLPALFIKSHAAVAGLNGNTWQLCSELVSLILRGPLELLSIHQGYSSTAFVSLVAGPGLLAAMNALLLRVNADRRAKIDRWFWMGLLVRQCCFVLLAGGLATYVTTPAWLMITAIPLVMYASLATLIRVLKRGDASWSYRGTEVLLGVILMEHLALPIGCWLALVALS